MRFLYCVALTASLVVPSWGGPVPRTYVSAENCKPCHLPEYEAWRKSGHAGATTAIRGADGFGPECLKCHATNSSESLPGVQCEGCHGPGSEYWPIPMMIDRDTAVKAGLLIQDQKLCDSCHDGQDHRSKVVFGNFKHDHVAQKDAVDLD